MTGSFPRDLADIPSDFGEGEPRVRTIDPEVLAHAEGISLKARIVGDAVVHGLHRSPRHGSSAEFADHKEYTPGDDPRHLDWRAFARFDREYIKRFENESNLRALALVDTSGSMGYRGGPDSERMSKLDFSAVCAGALGYVLARQGDAIGLGTFDAKLDVRVPPRARRGHVQEILHTLEQLVPQGTTALGPALDSLAEGMSRRMILALFTDLLDAGDGALEAIARIGARRHDVVLFHVMDPDELDFPFEESTLFTSMEDDREVQVDARAIRKAYLEEVQRFLERVRTTAQGARVEYHLLRSDQDPTAVLTRFVTARAGMRASAR